MMPLIATTPPKNLLSLQIFMDLEPYAVFEAVPTILQKLFAL